MTSVKIKPEPADMIGLQTVKYIINHWWLLFASGIVLVGVGIWVIKAPLLSYLSLSLVFAIAIIITGVIDIVLAFFNRHGKRWYWWLLAGLLDLAIGTYLFNNRLFTILILPVIIGLWTFYKGFMAIGDALHIRAYNFGNWRRLLFTALLVILMASLLLACQVIGIENIFLFSGFALIAAGLFRIYLGIKLRELNQYGINQQY